MDADHRPSLGKFLCQHIKSVSTGPSIDLRCGRVTALGFVVADGGESHARRRSWRWYKSPTSGRSVARAEFESLEQHGQAALLEAISRFRLGQELPGEVSKLKNCDDIWEIRVKVGTDPFRALFFFDTDIICVCVTAFYKNQQKTPESDKKTARQRRKAWLNEGKARGRLFGRR